MRVLIAEDDVALAKFVSQGLEAEHYTVDVCSDGEQARTAASEIDYDLIILDLNLPKLDGVAVLRQLRSKKPTLPVLVLTQRTRVEDRVQCLDTGADDYLPKPFSFSELSARIRALLRRSHLPSETDTSSAQGLNTMFHAAVDGAAQESESAEPDGSNTIRGAVGAIQ